jgi:hypothetical protein
LTALTVATGAVACGVCCIVPFAFPAVAAASAGSLLAWFAGAHNAATALATLIVAGAWMSIGFQSHRTRQKVSNATLYTMAIATAVLVVAVLWPRFEPYIIRAVTRLSAMHSSYRIKHVPGLSVPLADA